MRIAVAVIVVAQVLGALAATQTLRNGRVFYPEEAQPERRHFVMTADETGGHRLINLRQDPGRVDVTIDDVQVFLYTRENPRDGVLIELDKFTGVVPSEMFNPRAPIVVTTHGWTGAHMSNTNRLTRDGVLWNQDANVFIVAWPRPANLFYTYAAAAVPAVGEITATFINKLMANYGLSGDDVTLVGQSLGGQVVGVVGTQMSSPAAAIVALDPAGLLFDPTEPDTCLDATDAQQVHVFHTNGGFLGMRSAIGDADYHPNGGGMNQPGCGADVVGTCAHYRAYWLWGETLMTGGFRAVRCTSYASWKAGECDGNETSLMGQYPVDTNARGDYFLDTNGEEPFAMG